MTLDFRLAEQSEAISAAVLTLQSAGEQTGRPVPILIGRASGRVD